MKQKIRALLKVILCIGAALFVLSTPASAQSVIMSASPIPENAEKRFCYYNGLAFSESAFVLITGSNMVTSTSQIKEERLLRCDKSEDGNLTWNPQSTMQLGR